MVILGFNAAAKAVHECRKGLWCTWCYCERQTVGGERECVHDVRQGEGQEEREKEREVRVCVCVCVYTRFRVVIIIIT